MVKSGQEVYHSLPGIHPPLDPRTVRELVRGFLVLTDFALVRGSLLATITSFFPFKESQKDWSRTNDRLFKSIVRRSPIRTIKMIMIIRRWVQALLSGLEFVEAHRTNIPMQMTMILFLPSTVETRSVINNAQWINVEHYLQMDSREFGELSVWFPNRWTLNKTISGFNRTAVTMAPLRDLIIPHYSNDGKPN